MKFYVNLKTKEQTQATNKAFLWYKKGCNIAVVENNKVVNKWVHEPRKKGNK